MTASELSILCVRRHGCADRSTPHDPDHVGPTLRSPRAPTWHLAAPELGCAGLRVNFLLS